MVAIGSYAFNVRNRELFRKGEKVCRLTTKQSLVIRLLLEHANDTVSRLDLKHTLWPDGNDSDASLDNYISQLRKILAQDESIQILTIPKNGFKLKF